MSRIPDAINLTTASQFTQVPNDLLRTPELSWKAKGILCALLSNKEGWKSYVSVITKMATDGEDSVRSGLKELERLGYLVRIRYRCKQTKQFKGTFWGYTDTPGKLDLERALEMLDGVGFEIQDTSSRPDTENPHVENPHVENPPLKRLSNKNNNEKEEEEDIANSQNGESRNGESRFKRTRTNQNEKKITPSMFEEFWAMYPRKVDKGKAKTKWNQICNKPCSDNSRPTWGEIKNAIAAQSKSERWQDKQFIPHPTTWLNQQRWLDDPAEMKSFDSPSPSRQLTRRPNTQLDAPAESGPGPKRLFREKLGKDLGDWMFENCYKPARSLFTGPDGEFTKGVTRPAIAERLIRLYEQIQDKQKNLPPEFFQTHPSYGPLSIVRAYINYLAVARKEWLDSPTLNMVDVSHTTFSRFRREYARESDHLGRDPFTGLPSLSV